MARSEEQWKDLKTKIVVVVILAVVGGAVYAIGPGMAKFVDYARKNKDQKWAPEWYYKVGRVYEATWRDKEALKVYEEFYVLYRGDESKLPGIATVIEEAKYDTALYSLYPPFAARHQGEEWVGGEGAEPHPLMADVLMRVSIYEEQKNRNYPDARYAYKAVLNCFPSGTKAYASAEQAHKRDVSRAF